MAALISDVGCLITFTFGRGPVTGIATFERGGDNLTGFEELEGGGLGGPARGRGPSHRPVPMIVKGKGSGIELSRRDALVCTLRAGKIAEMGYYNDQQQALEAVGL